MLRLFILTIYHAISDTQGKSIKKMTRREPVCLLRALTFLANAIFKQLKSLNITASLGENAYVHLTTRSEREMHDDGETEERLESAGGEEEGWNGSVATAQWNYINLSECIWSWAFDRNGDGRMRWREARKCYAVMWLAADVFWLCARPEHWLFVMPKYSGGKGTALWYFQRAAVTHVVAPGHAGLVRVWLMVMM